VIVDSSALAAIVFQEPGHDELIGRLAAPGSRGIGTPTLVETGILLSARLRRDAGPLVARLLQEFDITAIPFGDSHWRAAVDAFVAFGKGRHPAALNFGDCCAYAVARLSGEPLLCVGDDFRQTDLALA
jgi:ribonuclease VapC